MSVSPFAYGENITMTVKTCKKKMFHDGIIFGTTMPTP
tara:strand:- start:2637 stop:2750 length:114 start_codon:yes stop_codon:yes gene_type:complete